jgi:hypothetical protein
MASVIFFSNRMSFCLISAGHDHSHSHQHHDHEEEAHDMMFDNLTDHHEHDDDNRRQ